MKYIFVAFIILLILIVISNVINKEGFNTMEQYLNTYKTDKLYHHKYFRFYPQFLDELNSSEYENTAMLEIGLDQGDSLLLWLDYFPKKHIYGIDINDKPNDNSRVTIFKGDQSNIEDLKNIANKLKHKICFIIDDGSHVPAHQVISFNYFFKNVLDFNGVYIIEDIETSYWKNSSVYGYELNYGYKNHKSLIEIFKHLIDFVNRQFLNETNLNELTNALNNSGLDIDTCLQINNISFGENNIIIKKVKDSKSILPLKLDYRFKNSI